MAAGGAGRTRGLIGTRIGRRLVSLFLGCALLPLVAFGWLSLTQVTDSLRAEVERELQQNARKAGQSLAQRMLGAADELGLAVALSSPQSPLAGAPPMVLTRLQQSFSSLQLVEGAEVRALFGPPFAFPPLSAHEQAHLATGRALARIEGDGRNARVVMARCLSGGEAGPLLVGEVRRFDIEVLRGAGMETLVFGGDHQLLGSTIPSLPDLGPMQRLLGTQPASATFEWQVAGEEHIAHYWRVFLRPQLGADWLVLMSKSRLAGEETVLTFRRTFLDTALLTLLVVVGASIAQIRRTIGPIRRLVEVTRRVAGGELDARASLSGRDEFAQLGCSFDDMTEQLVENIRRRELTEVDLVAARDAALTAVRAKADFMTNVSHELRTPLTSIVSAAEIMQNFGTDDPKVLPEFLDIVVSQSGRLQQLIEGVLALRDEDTSDFAPTDVVATLRQAIGGLRPAAQARVQLDSAVAEAPVHGAAERLAFVWRQLLDNAAKFSAADAPIAIRVRADGDDVVVEVADRGVGIARADHERIFEPFCQVGTDILTAKANGIGLGLTLARNIVGSHGGRIAVDSELGRGATFRVRLPRLPARAPRAPQSPAKATVAAATASAPARG